MLVKSNLIILIICSFFIGKVLFNSFHYNNIFAIFLYVGLGIRWLICFYHILKTELNNYKLQARFYKFWKSFISILSIVPALFIYGYFQSKIDKPTLLEANRHGVYADFKTDGTYIIKSGAWASKKHYYGTYTLHNNILEIDSSYIDGVLSSDRFLIKQSNPKEEMKKSDNDKLSTEKYLVQIDNAGVEIKTRLMGEDTLGNSIYIPFRFEVVIDKTK